MRAVKTLHQGINPLVSSTTFFFVISFFGSAVSFAQPKDTLYFYNNTKIVGELLRIRLGRVDFDADGIGILNIKNNKIESIHATSRNFRVETVNGEVLDGQLTSSDSVGMIWVIAGDYRRQIYVNDMISLTYFGQTWRSRLTGNISVGFTFTKSSEIGRLNLDEILKYNTDKTQTEIGGDMIVTYDSVEVDMERANFNLSHAREISGLWAAVVVLRYQRNVELGLDRRYQQALGIGRRIAISKNQQASVFPGIALNEERNLEGVKSNSSEFLIQANYDLFSFSSPNLTIDLAQTVYFGLSDTSRIRYDGDITFDYELIKNFYLSLQVFYNFDSRSPATNEPNNDYGFVSGLRFKF
jgi:hypothetical protein